MKPNHQLPCVQEDMQEAARCYMLRHITCVIPNYIDYALIGQRQRCADSLTQTIMVTI